MLPISQFKTAVLDFDDVVVRGSEQLKDLAWLGVFQDQAELKRVRHWQTHFANGKGDRFDILRESLKEIMDITDNNDPRLEAAIEEKARQFDEGVQSAILSIGVAHEDRAALVWCGDQGFKPFINSATPQAAIDETIDKLELRTLVSAVFGHQGSSSKVDNLARAAEITGASANEIFFVGDSDGDATAAKTFGCQFIGIATRRNNWQEKRPELELIDSLGRLPFLFG